MQGERNERQRLFEHRNGPVAWVAGLAALLLIALLLRYTVNVLGNGGGAWQQAELDTAINRFQQSALLAHAEWMRQGRGERVELVVGQPGAEQNVVVNMSAVGWPLPTAASSMSDEQCMTLWHELLGDIRPRITLQATWRPSGPGNEWKGECAFFADEQLQFVYSIHNGQMIRASQ